jgi:hypothetical protein
MVAFDMVVHHEFRQRSPKMALADHDHAIQALFLDRPHDPFSEGVAG